MRQLILVMRPKGFYRPILTINTCEYSRGKFHKVKIRCRLMYKLKGEKESGEVLLKSRFLIQGFAKTLNKTIVKKIRNTEKRVKTMACTLEGTGG